MRDQRDVMIDIETLGNSSSAAILSIGACEFDIRTGEIKSEFYRRVDMESALKSGVADASTIVWWMRQDSKAIAEITRTDSPSLEESLFSLRAFMASSDRVWGNGAAFDIPILENAYAAVESFPMWNRWNVQDVRTILRLAQDKDGAFVKGPFTGIPHNALNDAIFQAKYVSKAYASLLP